MLEDREQQTAVPFIRASTVRRELVMESRVYDVWGHWDTSQNCFRFCGLEACALCRDGFKAERRFILRCSDGFGDSYLLELRERHLQPLRTLDAIARSGQKPRFALVREGSARNSPISLSLLEGSASGTLYDLARLVARLYAPAIECEDVIADYIPKPRFDTEEDERLQEVMRRKGENRSGLSPLRSLGL